jgi:6-phosphogluconolactonase
MSPVTLWQGQARVPLYCQRVLQCRARSRLVSGERNLPVRRSNVFRWVVTVALVCTTLLAGGASALAAAGSSGTAGAVYTSTNSPAGNAVVIFSREANGTLAPAGIVPTGGLGTGAGLGSQGAVVHSENQRWLFVVNAGSNDVSVFAINGSGLSLAGRTPSGGIRPVSVTVYKDLVYVLNAGSDSITGFRLSPDGTLTELVGSTRPLSGTDTGAAQVQFTPDGRVLVVTERATNLIDTFAVGPDGMASGPQVWPSAGTVPFGFAITKDNVVVVSEAGARATSSYRVAPDGTLTSVSPSVGAQPQLLAACWVVATKNGKFAYTANAGSAAISGFSIDHDGSLTLLDADGITGATGPGSGPIDMALSHNSQFLYVLSNRNMTIVAFGVNPDGSLTPLGSMTDGLMAGAVGLAAS